MRIKRMAEESRSIGQMGSTHRREDAYIEAFRGQGLDELEFKE